MITDPPFGVDNQSNMAVTQEGKAHATKILNDETPEQAMEIFTKVMGASLPAMKDESDIYIFTAHQVLKEWLGFTDELFAPHDFTRRAILVWEKDGPGMGDLNSWGMGCEFILYFKRGARVPTAPRRNNVIHFPQLRPGTLSHPHEKPTGLLEILIKYSTIRGDLLFDPFGGSGSLVRAARNISRSAVAVELDKPRYEKALRKLDEGDQGMDFGED